MLFDFLLFEKMYQRNCIKFCIKNEIKWVGIFEVFTVAFGEPTMSRTQVQLSYIRFKEDQEDFNNDVRPFRPSTSTTHENSDAVKKMILDMRRITIRVDSDDVRILIGSCQPIFTNVLDMNRMAAIRLSLGHR